MEAQSRRDISSNSDVSPTPIADTAESVDEAFVHRQTWSATLQPCRLCEIQKQCPPTRLRRFHLRLRLRWTRRRASFAYARITRSAIRSRERSERLAKMAERVGFATGRRVDPQEVTAISF